MIKLPKLKNPKLRYIPWTGLCMVIGMWGGAKVGQQIQPENYLTYSSAGLAIGLVLGWIFERMVKKRGEDGGEIRRSSSNRYR